MFDPTDEDQSTYSGYGPSPLPEARDADIDEFVQSLMAAGASVVQQTTDASSRPGQQVLNAYAERMASLAVRERDRERLLRAIVALVVGGYANLEPDPTTVMALIEQSARHLAVSLEGLFQEASAHVGAPGTAALMMWMARPGESRDLASMHFVEAFEAGGIRYRYDPDGARAHRHDRLN